MTEAGFATCIGGALAFVLAALVLTPGHAEDQTSPRPGAPAQQARLAVPMSVPPAQDGTVARWRPFIEEGSRRFGVPTAWIERVMRAESGGLTTLNGRPIISPAGAMGLMQLMPSTWSEMRARYGLGSDPFDPRDNILAGAAFLAEMHSRFGYPGLFGAYNAGPARYADWLAGRRTLPAETRAYLARVAPEGTVGGTARMAPSPPAAAPLAPVAEGLFAVNRPDRGRPSASAQSTTRALFVSLGDRQTSPAGD